MQKLDVEKHWLVVRFLGCGVVVVGLFLLARLLYAVFGGPGSGSMDVIDGVEGAWGLKAAVLALRLPVPLHVISVGLIVQRRWLPRAAARAAWVSVMISGCWLGMALAARLLLFER
jgi:hypothetical protein